MTEMKKKLRKEIYEGELLPTGYGISYLELNRLVAVAYPIPLNVIIAYARKFWFWLRSGDYYKSGYDKGYFAGKEDGRKYAFNQYKKIALRGEIEDIIKRFSELEDKQLDYGIQKGWIHTFIKKETERLYEH